MNIVDKITGNTYTAAEFTEFKNEVQNMIKASGLTLAGGSVQLKQAVSRAAANAASYTENGIANAYNLIAIGLNDKVTAYQDGAIYSFVTTNTNTGASTLKIDGLLAKDIKKEGFTNALDAGDIVSGRLFMAYYRSSSDNFELLDVTQAKGILKNNFTAVAAPTVSNDNTEGFSVGSEWLDTTTDIFYKASSVGTGTADWEKIVTSDGAIVISQSVIIRHADNTTTKFSDSVNNTEPACDQDGGTTVANIIPVIIGEVATTRIIYRSSTRGNNSQLTYIIYIDWATGDYKGTIMQSPDNNTMLARFTGSLGGGVASIVIVEGSYGGDLSFEVDGSTVSGVRQIDALPKTKEDDSFGSGETFVDDNLYEIISYK